MTNHYANECWIEHQRYLESPEGRCDTLMEKFNSFEKQIQDDLGEMRKLVGNIQTEILDPVKKEMRKAIEAANYNKEWADSMMEYYKPSDEDISKINEILMKKHNKESENESKV